MRHLYTLAILFLAGYSSAAQSVTDLDAKYGFRDVKFESDTTVLIGRKLVERGKDGTTTYYVRPSDNPVIGDGRVGRITYCYYKGKFSMVMIDVDGQQNLEAVLSALRRLYGTGFDASTGWSWRGETTHAMLSKQPGRAALTISSRTLAQLRREEKEAAERAALGL